MKDQQDLFNQPLHTPTNGTATSLEAAALVTRRERARPKRERQIVRVLEAIRVSPRTDEEIGIACGLAGSSVRPRRGELVRDGLVRDSGVLRRTRQGSRATVWEAIPQGERPQG